MGEDSRKEGEDQTVARSRSDKQVISLLRHQHHSVLLAEGLGPIAHIMGGGVSAQDALERVGPVGPPGLALRA